MKIVSGNFVLIFLRWGGEFVFPIDLLKSRPVIPLTATVNSVSYWTRATFPKLGGKVYVTELS